MRIITGIYKGRHFEIPRPFKAQADEMNSLLKYLIKQAVVRYYNGVEYINQ